MSLLFEFIRQSLLFPMLQSIHILGLIVLVGTISLVDFRLLGVGKRRRDASELASGVAPWTFAGLLVVLVTGPLLFGADVVRYVNNPAFVLKMGLLVAALAVHFTLHRSVTRADGGSALKWQRVVAVLSILLWSAVVLAGRAIADFDIRVI